MPIETKPNPTRAEAHAKLMTLAGDGFISQNDMLEIRRTVFPDGIVDRDEVELLFALGERAPKGAPGWPALFAEICADFFLNEEQPEGYLTDEEFAFLAELIEHDGKLASPIELHALIALADRARDFPKIMARFIAAQLKALIAHRTEPAISSADVELIRAFVYATGGEGSIGISREEADFLFELNDLSAGANHAPVWNELFVKAIAAHLMHHVGYAPLPREEALRLSAWAGDTQVSPGRFLSAMVGGGLKAIRDSYAQPNAWENRNRIEEAGIASVRQVTADEAAWLARRIGRNGTYDDNERALLIYMRDHLNAELPKPLSEMAHSVRAENAA